MSAAYGWSDEDVMNLTIARFRQIVSVVNKRRLEEYKAQALLTEWETRTLATFIAASVPVPKGKKNPLMPYAEKISLHWNDDADSKDDDSPPEVFVEEGSQVAEKRNKEGSFEALLQGFGM